jgi:hypothetical protein
MIAALRTLGFTNVDRIPLRFAFEADSARHAVDLATDLRALGRNRVHLVPQRTGAPNAPVWGVALKTRPTPVGARPIRQLEEEMEAVARGRPGSRYVGWKPMLEPRKAKCRVA